eukprot:Em0006g533a
MVTFDYANTDFKPVIIISKLLPSIWDKRRAYKKTMATLCDRNAIELKRYGAPGKWTPYRTWLPNVATMCGRGSKLLWLLPCVSPRIPDPVPPTNLDASQVV